MFFFIPNKYKYDYATLLSKIGRAAKRKILLYKTGATELALNEYLINKYNKSLKHICMALIDSMWPQKTSDGIILVFKLKEAEELAQLITYGDGKLQGSQILKVAFTWN